MKLLIGAPLYDEIWNVVLCGRVDVTDSSDLRGFPEFPTKISVYKLRYYSEDNSKIH